MPESPRRTARPPYFLILLCLLVMGAAVAVVLDRAGPCRGWIAKVRERLQQPADTQASPAPAEPAGTAPPTISSPGTPAAPVLAETPTSPTATDEPPSSVPAGEKSELEERYEKLYSEFLAEAPRPPIGQNYDLTLQSGSRIRGKLEKTEPGLVTMRLKYGTMAYPVHVIARADVLKLFPEIAARARALAALRGEPEKEPAADPGPAPTIGSPALAALPTPATESASQLHYDPAPGPTPEELKPTLLAFGEWLKGQHRRVGGRIADRIFARSQAGCAVLYLRMDPAFLAQDYGTRFQIAEGMQTFWGLRCESNGVATVSRAHVVLLDQTDRIIGGSRPYAASEIWLSKK